MRASYLLEAKYICVHAKKGKYECEAESSYGAAKKAAEHWGLKGTSGIDAHLADKPKTATEGIEGMTPNTQVRGIMPKQRKPYHKHKIKSDHEPETDLSERGVDDVGQKIYKGNTTRVVHTPVADKNISVADKRIDKFASDRAMDDMTYKGAKMSSKGTNQTIAKAQNNIKQAYTKQDKIDQRSGAGTSYITKGKPIKFGNNNSNVKIAMDSEMKKSKSILGEVTKELTEAEFDEAAGEKDACYRKVKSRYKVWPSAYASGALVKCRKVGAANWGNKSKK